MTMIRVNLATLPTQASIMQFLDNYALVEGFAENTAYMVLRREALDTLQIRLEQHVASLIAQYNEMGEDIHKIRAANANTKEA